jgi:hypothetical protein
MMKGRRVADYSLVPLISDENPSHGSGILGKTLTVENRP